LPLRRELRHLGICPLSGLARLTGARIQDKRRLQVSWRPRHHCSELRSNVRRLCEPPVLLRGAKRRIGATSERCERRLLGREPILRGSGGTAGRLDVVPRAWQGARRLIGVGDRDILAIQVDLQPEVRIQNPAPPPFERSFAISQIGNPMTFGSRFRTDVTIEKFGDRQKFDARQV
jgi:hypothetical protein